jgi:hypothetical protein
MSEFDDIARLLEPYSLPAAETWKKEHAVAMRAYRLEDAIAAGLMLHQLIHRHFARWRDFVADRSVPFSWDAAREWSGLFQWWLSISQTLLEAIAECEAQGHIIEKAQDFRRAVAETQMLPLNVDAVREDVEALEAGHGILMGRAMDELRNRLRAERAP